MRAPSKSLLKWRVTRSTSGACSSLENASGSVRPGPANEVRNKPTVPLLSGMKAPAGRVELPMSEQYHSHTPGAPGRHSPFPSRFDVQNSSRQCQNDCRGLPVRAFNVPPHKHLRAIGTSMDPDTNSQAITPLPLEVLWVAG